MDLSIIFKVITEIKSRIDVEKSNSKTAHVLKQHLDTIESMLKVLPQASTTAGTDIHAEALQQLRTCLTDIQRFLEQYQTQGLWYDFLHLLKSKSDAKKLTAHLKALFEWIGQLNLGVSADIYGQVSRLTDQVDAFNNAVKTDLEKIQDNLSTEIKCLTDTMNTQTVALSTLQNLGEAVISSSSEIQKQITDQETGLKETKAQIIKIQDILSDCDIKNRLTTLSSDLAEIKDSLALIKEKYASPPPTSALKTVTKTYNMTYAGQHALFVGNPTDTNEAQSAERSQEDAESVEQAMRAGAQHLRIERDGIKGEQTATRMSEAAMENEKISENASGFLKSLLARDTSTAAEPAAIDITPGQGFQKK